MNRIVAAVLVLAGCAAARAEPPACRARPDLAGPCYRVSGELGLYNGTPSARIRVARSRRAIGVASYFDKDGESFDAPESLRKRVSFDTSLRGVFEVCPLEKAAPDRMQTVCIARTLRVK